MTADRTAPRPRITTVQLVSRIALVLLVAGAITKIALTNPDGSSQAPPTATPAVQTAATSSQPMSVTKINASEVPANPLAITTSPFEGGGHAPQSGVPAIPNPKPWQYDPATDLHYDPNHGHWHKGPAPSDASRAAPAIPNPQPWQYDPVTNKHWNPLPGHQHWHDGPPPAEDSRGG